MAMREVRLYGHLAERFGKVFNLDVRTIGEAIAALRANLPGFETHLAKHSKPGYHVVVGKRDFDESELQEPCGRGTIKIIPVIAGAKTGFGKIVLGAVLVVAGLILEQPWMVKAGIMMVVGGVAQLLSQSPKLQRGEKPENTPSYSFNGPVNTVTQGNPVPVCYGEMIVGSQVASFGLSVDDLFVHIDPPGEQAPSNGIPPSGWSTTVARIEHIGAENTSTSEAVFLIYPSAGIGHPVGNYSYILAVGSPLGAIDIDGAPWDGYRGAFIVSAPAYPQLADVVVGAALLVTTPLHGGGPAWNDM